MDVICKENGLSPISPKQVNSDNGLKEITIKHPATELPLLPNDKLEEKEHCENNRYQERSDLSTRLL